MPPAPPEQIDSCITRWEDSGAAESANYQMFLSELCDVLGIPRPDPISPDPAKNLHIFDRAMTRVNPGGSSVDSSADEPAKPTVTKSGQAFDCTFLQGRGYITLPPVAEGRPPFLVPVESGNNSSP